MNVIGWVGGVHKCPYMVMWNEECHWMMVHKVRRRARRRSSVFCMEKERVLEIVHRRSMT